MFPRLTYPFAGPLGALVPLVPPTRTSSFRRKQIFPFPRLRSLARYSAEKSTIILFTLLTVFIWMEVFVARYAEAGIP